MIVKPIFLAVQAEEYIKKIGNEKWHFRYGQRPFLAVILSKSLKQNLPNA